MSLIEVSTTFWTEKSLTTFLIISANIADHNNVSKRSKIFYGKVVQNKSEVAYLLGIYSK